MVSHSPPLLRRARGRIRWLIAYSLWAGAVVSVTGGLRLQAAETVVDPTLPVLQSINDIYAVPPAMRNELHAVDMEAQIAYIDPAWNMAYVVSGDAPPQYVDVGKPVPKLRMRDVARLTGMIRPGSPFTLASLSPTRIETDRPLRAIIVEDNLASLLRLQIVLVQLEAFVEGQSLEDESHLNLHLVAGTHRIHGVLLLDPDAPVPDFVGHRLTLEGLLVPEREPQAAAVARLFVGGPDAIRSWGRATDDVRFTELPVTPIADLARYAVEAEVGSSRRIPWVHIEGRVISIETDRNIILTDATGRIRVSTAQTLGVGRDQRIAVCGIPMLTPRGWRLERPIIRPVTPSGPEATSPSVLVAPAPAGDQPAGAAGIDQPIPPEQLPLLATIQDYWNVPTDRQRWLHRFSFEMHVGYCDPGWDVMWAESGGQMAFVNIRRSDVDFATGDVIRVSGLVRPVPGAFVINPAVTVETLATGRPFDPVVIEGNLTDPAHEGQMVRLTGLVERQEEVGPYHGALWMIVEGFPVVARFRTYELDRLANFTGHFVTLEGILSAERSGAHDFRATLWVGRLSSIDPGPPLARDPRFAVAPTFIETLPTSPKDQPVHLVGTIREVRDGKSVTIEDRTDRVTIQTAQKIPGAINTRIEAWGYPATDGVGFTLTRPVLRELSILESTTALDGPTVRSTYRSAADVLNLSASAAAGGLPVKLTGVVTWSSPHAAQFFIRDASAGIQVTRPPGDSSAALSPGAIVVVTGFTANDGATRQVQATSIALQTSRILDDPPLTTVEQARTGSQDAQRIKLAGYVRDVSHVSVGGTPRWTVLELVGAEGLRFRASLPHDPTADQFRGGVVRVTGVCKATTRGDTYDVEEITLHLNLLTDIEEVDKPLHDPSDGTLQSIQSLRSFGGLRRGIGLARVRGQVIAHLPGDGLVVRETFGENPQGIDVFLSEPGLPPIGSTIDLVGFVGHGATRVALREARHRIVDHAAPVASTALETVKPDGNLDFQLVRVQARLVDTIRDDRRLMLRMSSDGLPFHATLAAAQATPELLEHLLPGALLELTGVYRLERTDAEHTDEFSLLLRGAADVVSIERPSWFTARRARMLAGGLGVIVALAFGWAYALRRRVQHQTGQIRRQLIREARLEDRQRKIIEKASDFIFMLDPAGRFTLFNPAGEAMTGYTSDDVPRLSIYDLIDESDAIGLRTALAKAHPGSEIQPFQTRFRRKDGTLIWAEVAMRFLVEDERVTGALCVARDITERKRVEEELKRARDAAEANTQAKSAFLANMSHEIRTPMNGVIGMSNLLLDTHLSHEQRDFALTIRNSAEALLTVLNDILDFSKIEAGKLQFETLDFELTEAVDDTLDLLAARAASKHIELAAIIPATLPQRLRGDPGRLRQVLLNLVGNAIKFTEGGTVTVSVSHERETRTGHVLRFEVRDTGIGIEPEAQQRLFLPFSQADVSTTRKYGGTGLGLAICRQIVEQLHGSIGVYSEPGQGSTFWFTMEFARGTPVASEPLPGALRGVRVLGVDDNEVNRVVLQYYLEPTGVRLDLASSAAEALGMIRAAAAAGDPFRLALLDYHMPAMDGLGLARAVRADGRFGGLSLALLTSVDRRFTENELAELGITASMAKPIRQRELTGMVTRVVHAGAAAPDRSRPTDAAAPGATDLPVLRILVAEDNPVNQRLTRIQLKKLGYEADLACNGLEVLEAFERVAYDVIFMDCQMPELDGYDTARRLAGHPRRSEVRIVAMTANAMQGDRDKCLESGMDDYLSKPTRPDDLAAALRRAAEAITRSV